MFLYEIVFYAVSSSLPKYPEVILFHIISNGFSINVMNISYLVISRLQSVSGKIEMNIEVMRAEGDICYVTLFLVLCGCRGCAKPERRVEAVDP